MNVRAYLQASQRKEMEARMLLPLVVFLSLLALATLVSPRPQESEGQNNDAKESEVLKEDDEPEEHGELAEENDGVCRTEVCQNRASLIKSYLNEAFSPCEDFYSYVCDNWVSQHKNTGPYDSFQMLEQEYAHILTDLLNSTEPMYTNQTVIDKPAVLFNSCMASTREEEQQSILEILRDSGFTMWPMNNQSADNEKMFWNVSEVLVKVGMSALIQYYVTKNSPDKDAHGIKILPLGIRNVPKEDINSTVKLIKPDILDTDLEKLVQAIINLELQWIPFRHKAIKKMTTGAWSQVTTIDSLEENCKKIPLYKLLSDDFTKVGVNLERNETVEVYGPTLYEEINNFLKIVDPAALYNYFGLQLTLHLISRSVLLVQDAYKPIHCTNLVNTAMKEVVGYHYAKKYFPIRAKMEVETIVQRIKSAFEVAINDTKWMDTEIKEKAQKKLSSMVAKIAYPEWALNTTVLEKLYEYVPFLNLNVTFLKMMHWIEENTDKKTMEKLRKPFVKDMEWFSSQSRVNAFYIGMKNEFVYPAGGLQRPFYQLGLPWSLNFGGAGTVIGHEITHAFGSRASHFDEIRKVDGFKKAAECFQNQYGNTTDEETGLMLNGTRTLDENMADNIGLQMALMAYQKMVAEDCGNTTTSLEGLDGMTGLRLFFVTYGMLWCHATSQEKLKSKIENDSYSPNRYRVNIPVYNLEAFTTAFNCSNKSPMQKNFTRTCKLW